MTGRKATFTKKALPIFLCLTFTLTFVSLAPPHQAQASSVTSQLRATHSRLTDAKADLRHIRALLAQAQSQHLVRGLGLLQRAETEAERRVRRLRAELARLRRLRAATRAASRNPGSWWPLLKVIAGQNGISAAGLYRMMILESGGRVRAVGGGGVYLGLYQYSLPTWHGSWNPWRKRSIFDGEAQIRATARALRLGYGPYWWPNTYRRAF